MVDLAQKTQFSVLKRLHIRNGWIELLINLSDILKGPLPGLLISITKQKSQLHGYQTGVKD